jgi:hypothetical protein
MGRRRDEWDDVFGARMRKCIVYFELADAVKYDS